MSRTKGIRGEREVCAFFNEHGFDVRRVPNSGGLWIPGDIAGLAGFIIECKRAERLDIPAWLRQVWAAVDRAHEVGKPFATPLLAFRRNARPDDPLGIWHVVLPLDALARVLAEARR